jgi:hypothetical protein
MTSLVLIAQPSNFVETEGQAKLSSNDNLVLAGTLHGIHAITARLSPTVGSSSGAQVIEAETFKMTIFLTATGTLLGAGIDWRD